MTVATEPARPAPTHRLACPRCRAPMAALVLSSHTGRSVTVDHCGPCRQIWFDQFESVALDARGWIRLLRQLKTGAALPLFEQVEQAAAGQALACPECHAALKPVSNQSRFGRFTALECPHQHGHLHGLAGVLAERGLVRPLGARERKALQEERHRITCFNCGAPADGHDERCGYCRSPLVVIDLPRLMHSLKARVVNEGLAPAARPGQSLHWRCRSCGTSLDPATDALCPQCGHLVVSLELPDIEPLLAAAEVALDAPRDAQPAKSQPASAQVSGRLGEGAYGPAWLDRRADEILEDARGSARDAHWAWELSKLALQWLRAILTR